MNPAEWELLVRDKLAQAERDAERKALPNSLSEKVLDGYFGKRSRELTILRRAREISRSWVLG